MKVEILDEQGFGWAMRGLALSYNKNPDDMPDVALRLGAMDRGHSKFLESIVVWIEVTAPLDFHIQLDTYRVGMTKQSESTMHTLMKTNLTQANFQEPIPNSYLNYLNSCIDGGAPLHILKKKLPCGFLQKRLLCTNYKTLKNIIQQRATHTLPEWRVFVKEMKKLKWYDYMGIDR